MEIDPQNSVIFWLDNQKLLSEERQKYSKHADKLQEYFSA